MKQSLPFFYEYELFNRDLEKEYCSVFCIKIHSVEALQNQYPNFQSYEKLILQDKISLQSDFVNTLYRNDFDCTYTLRYISRPGASGYTSGDIDIVLFCKTSHTNKETSQVNAKKLFEEIIYLVSTMISGYHWIVISDQESFNQLFTPFPFNKLQIAEIVRRQNDIKLDSMMTKPSLIKELNQETDSSYENVHFIHRYIPRYNEFVRILKLMLLYDYPIILQINLTPMGNIDPCLDALLKNVSLCEKYLQKINKSNDSLANQSKFYYKERAQYLISALMDQYLKLQDAPFYMQTLLISQNKLPLSFLETTGVEFTSPIGSNSNVNSNRILDIQMGGYDVITYTGTLETKINETNLLDRDIHSLDSANQHPNLLRYLFDATEANCAFRLPIALSEEIPGITQKSLKSLPLPREISSAGLKSKKTTFIGKNHYLGFTQDILLTEKDRSQHLYTIGQTGTGKSTLLKTMILSDINQGNGLALVDPHGDLFEEILGLIPKERMEDVVILDPTDKNYPVGLNLLEIESEEESHYVVREMKAIMEKLIEDQYGMKSAQDYTGPIFYELMQKNMLLVMSNPTNPGTLLDFYEIFIQKDYWKKWQNYKGKNSQLKSFIQNTLPYCDYQAKSPGYLSNAEYVRSKFEDFIFDPVLRNIFGQKKSTINFLDIMNEKKILLINLAKGKLTEANSMFLGMIIISKLYSSAMKRAKMPIKDRKMFYLYVDEFQSLATQNFSMILSEARKFSLSLTLANQFVTQIKNPRIMDSIFGNVATFITFRVSREDARFIAPNYYPSYSDIDLMNLPNRNAVVLTKSDGQNIKPFSFETVLPPTQPDPATAKQIIELSRKKYARPSHLVQEEIEKSLAPYDNKIDFSSFASFVKDDDEESNVKDKMKELEKILNEVDGDDEDEEDEK